MDEEGKKPINVSPMKIKVVERRRFIVKNKKTKDDSASVNSNDNCSSVISPLVADTRIVNLRSGKKCTPNTINRVSDPNAEIAEADGMRLTVNAPDEDNFGDDNLESDDDDPGTDLDYDEGLISEEEEVNEDDNGLKDDQVSPTTHVSSDQLKPSEVAELCDDDSEIQFNYNLHSQKLLEPQSEKEAVQFLASNPHLSNIFKKMIKEGIQEQIKIGNDQQGQDQGYRTSSLCETPVVNKSHSKQTPIHNKSLIKSPSDTTIYAPALRKIAEDQQSDNVLEKISNFVESIHLDVSRKPQRDQASTSTAR